MKLTVEIPDDTAQALGLTETTAGRTLLEAAAVEAYRAQKIGAGLLCQVLGLSSHEKDALLLRHGVFYDYAPGEIAAEAAEMVQLLERRRTEKAAA